MSWRRRDGVSAKRLNPNDRQRLARALEVVDATGHPLHYWQEKAQGGVRRSRIMRLSAISSTCRGRSFTSGPRRASTR